VYNPVPWSDQDSALLEKLVSLDSSLATHEKKIKKDLAVFEERSEHASRQLKDLQARLARAQQSKDFEAHLDYQTAHTSLGMNKRPKITGL
jgi:hypothetical protein